MIRPTSNSSSNPALLPLLTSHPRLHYSQDVRSLRSSHSSHYQASRRPLIRYRSLDERQVASLPGIASRGVYCFTSRWSNRLDCSLIVSERRFYRAELELQGAVELTQRSLTDTSSRLQTIFSSSEVVQVNIAATSGDMGMQVSFRPSLCLMV